MPKPYTKTSWNKEPKEKKEQSKKKTTKRDRLATEAERLGVLHIFLEYRKRLKSATRKEFADRVYSDYVCITHANKDGLTKCSTCPSQLLRDDPMMQNGHYRTRAHMHTRFHDGNCHPQCRTCNCARKGNYRQYYLFIVGTYGEEYEDWLWNNDEKKNIKNYEYAEMIQQWYLVIQLKRKEIDLEKG